MQYGFDMHLGLVEWLPGDGCPSPLAFDVSPRDRSILRDLAKKVAAIAARQEMADLREAWRRHNRLEPGRPLVLVFPEGAWRELITPDRIECETPETRRIEQLLRCRIFQAQQIKDDLPISAEWQVDKVITQTGWGLEDHQRLSGQATGAWAFEPVLNDFADVEKIQMPKVDYDEAASVRALDAMQNLFGDVLDVTLKGVTQVHFGMICQLTLWRGLDQTLLDFCMNPGFIHDAMARIAEGHANLFQQYEDLGLLDLNNDETYHSSGGIGITDELPARQIEGKVLRKDLWASAQAQELTTVGPEMHAEFALRYERPLLEEFGLSGYGCCENLTDKLQDVMTIGNLRRVSVSPWADVRRCAEQLKRDYILSRKPHPAQMVGDFSEERIREHLREDLEASRGCVVELVMKDTHTVEGDKARLATWARAAKELAEDMA